MSAYKQTHLKAHKHCSVVIEYQYDIEYVVCAKAARVKIDAKD